MQAKINENICDNENLAPSNTIQSTSCPACLNNDQPSGNHKCYICLAPVHNLDSFSTPLDVVKGFSQKRICGKCKDGTNTDVIIASREKEN